MKGLLKDNFPELVKEWDFETNTLSIDEVMWSSNKKAYWVCVKGHKWEARIDSRTGNRKSKCPKCQNKAVSDDNSLAVVCPDLSKEWDFEKNYPLTPDMVTYGSAKEVGWICPKGHKWDARISSRSGRLKQGCSYCDGKKVSVENSLGHNFPELISEWDTVANYPLTPFTITKGSNRLMGWVCKRGHKWDATVCNRTGKGKNNCPECNFQSSRLQIFIYCELKYFYPDVKYRYKIDGMECDAYIPNINMAVEIDGGIWHKDSMDKDRNKVEILNSKGVSIINVREDGLPIVNKLTVSYARNSDYLTVSKGLVKMLYQITGNANLIAYQGFTYPINEQLYNKEIARFPLDVNAITLEESNPKLCEQWDYVRNGDLKPCHVAAHSNCKVWWIDKIDKVSVSNRNNKKNSSPQPLDN